MKTWISAPLLDPDEINARLDGVAELAGRPDMRKEIERILRSVHDVERLIGRACLDRANPRDLLSLAESLEGSYTLREVLTDARTPILTSCASDIADLRDLASAISDALVENPPVSLNEGGIFRDGYLKDLDDIRDISRSGRKWIADYQADERQRTGISNLKVGYNNVFGYYIEISKGNLDRVPEDYHRKQTLVNAERFITPGLKEYEEKVLGASERIAELERSLFADLRHQAAARVRDIQAFSRAAAVADVLRSFAETAQSRNYVRPEIDSGTVIDIRDGRHPVVETLLPSGAFVSNDTLIDTESDQILIITGPNMAGKSTFLRQVGLIVLMAQAGSFVPASSARIGAVDRIFTRVGASDNLAGGESTFLVEMHETANILNNCTIRSLILFDEVGRGTSTFDGLSIAWSIVEYLHQVGHAAARTLFATHFHELTELESLLERVKNYNVAVKEWNEEIVFLRKILPGGSDQSLGIQVARLAGLPRKVIDRAKDILTNLEANEFTVTHKPRIAGGRAKPHEGTFQLNLFELPEHPVVEEIAGSTSRTSHGQGASDAGAAQKESGKEMKFKVLFRSYSVLRTFMMYLMALVALAVFNTLALAASSTQGYAISFDNSKFITIPNSSSLNPSRFTLECWVRFLDVEDNGSTFFIISKGFQKAPGAYSIWYYGGDKKLAFGVSDAQDNYYFFFADHAPLVSNRWYHVAGTYDGNALKLYLNSELIGEKDVGSITLGNKNPLQFGDLFEGYVSTRHGIIDEVRIWSVARTPEEISEIMYQEIDTAPGLISAWHFNEGSGQSVSDATGGNNGYLGSASSEDNNDPQWVQSDAPAPDSPFLQVFSPNGGEEWQMGMVQTIRWTAWKIATIHIEYSPDGGISWRTVADTIDAASGSYTWIAPEAVTSDGLIRITDSSNSGYTDVSDSAFSVLNPYIRLLSPIGGEKWETGTIQNITWNSLGVEKVIPDYSTDNGSTWTPISGEMVASADTLAWKIPYTSSETCRVRIRTPDSSVLSINESPFSIFKSGITLENQEGEILQPKAEGWVYWEATQGVDSVRVEYSADDGATWRLLGITFRIPLDLAGLFPRKRPLGDLYGCPGPLIRKWAIRLQYRYGIKRFTTCGF